MQEWFDYIVVGSGAGGGVVAARLAQAGYRVVVLEAGGDPVGNVADRSAHARDVVADYRVPAFHPFASEHPDMAWDFWVRHYSDQQQQARDKKYSEEHDGVLYPRAGTLGGCTAHNAMITVYPHHADWNHIAEIMQDESWRADRMAQYFQRMEKCRYRFIYWVLSCFGINPSGHGWSGWYRTEKALPLDALFRGWRLRFTFRRAIRSIFRQLGYKWLRLEWLLESQGDPNDRRLIDEQAYGARYTPMSTVKHVRHGTRELLLDVKQTHGDKLLIRLHALVTNIIFDEDDPTRAVGVAYLSGSRLYEAHQTPNTATGEACEVYAHKEVIICGGAFNTPQLMMLSGIGPKKHLEDKKIQCRLELDGVGKNLQDRYEISVVNKMKTPWRILRNGNMTTDDELYRKWRRYKKGVYTTNGSMISVILPSDYSKARPDLFLFAVLADFHGYYKGYAKDTAKTNYLSWTVLKAHTKNTAGQVKLVNNNPKARPEINFHYFDEGTDTQGDDLHSVSRGVEVARNLSATMKKLVDHEEWPGGNKVTPDDVKQFIKDEAWGHHACGTCAMKPLEEDGVVDSKFRVYGTKNLRIVDASIFPRIPGFFIVTSVYMIAEKAAEDLIEAAK